MPKLKPLEKRSPFNDKFNGLHTKFQQKHESQFDGGNLSSDTGLLFPRSFDETLGLSQLIERSIQKTAKRYHLNADVIR